MLRIVGLALLALGLAACAGKPIEVACPEFKTRYTLPLPEPKGVAELRGDVGADDLGTFFDKTKSTFTESNNRQAALIQRLLGGSKPTEKGLLWKQENDAPRPTALLMLSGGGQWGAFGAGFLERAQARGALPPFRVVTGVSTGALQALYLGQGNDPATRTAALEQLRIAYSPVSGNEIVDQRGYAGVVLKGSMAGLDKIKAKIETALCESPGKCSGIDRLKSGGPQVLIGFVEATSGEFRFAYLNAIAADAPNPEEAQQCIAGALLASVAIPLYYQQVKVDGVTYFDGGVRHSVFESFVERLLSPEAAATYVENAEDYRTTSYPPAYDRYVLRNGPTVADPIPESKGGWSAFSAAKRGYALIVNQGEVSALAALRLERPKGRTFYISADGYRTIDRIDGDAGRYADGCPERGDGVMFDPAFMACLRALGARKADADRSTGGPWVLLSDNSK